MLRYLFGPVTAEFAEQNLAQVRQSGHCLTFHPEADADLVLSWQDTWEDLTAQFPTGWYPDFILLYLPYTVIPACLWSAPVPLIGLVADASLLWPLYRKMLPWCDWLLCDEADAIALHQRGLWQAQGTSLWPLQQAPPSSHAKQSIQKDIDVLVITESLSTPERPAGVWLNQLADLADDWRIQFCATDEWELFLEACPRARIVLAIGRASEQTWWLLEAIRKGALLLLPSGRKAMPSPFQEGSHYLVYQLENWPYLLQYYLTHEAERESLVVAAQQQRDCFSVPDWQGVIDQLQPSWPQIQTRQGYRPRPGRLETLFLQSQQVLNSGEGPAAWLTEALQLEMAAGTDSPLIQLALGLLSAVPRPGQEEPTDLAATVLPWFQKAATAQASLLAQFNLALALAQLGENQQAGHLAEAMLAEMARPASLPLELWDGFLFPLGEGKFNREWANIGWRYAACPGQEQQAKKRLLTGHLHGLVGKAKEDLGHLYEAALARPDLPDARAALGQALVQGGQLAEAAEHLQAALDNDPWQTETASSLWQAWRQSQDRSKQGNFLRHYRRLAGMAPQWFPPECFRALFPATGKASVSLLILCCNELAYTRQCLQSVFRNTQFPYELILVDNGSTDGTAAFLRGIQIRPEPRRIVVLHNEKNLGFAAGVNQALAVAEGEYIVLLNNDTIVTPHWLEDLVEASCQDWPKVGLVGPVSNYAPPPQEVRPGYTNLSELETFAAHRRRHYGDRFTRVNRLTGFCLLIRRDMLETGLDERYGMGFFEDDDLCLRVQQAGCQLLLAQGVYIHHFGSRTFAGLGLDTSRLLRENWKIFQDKWGQEATKHYPPLPPADVGNNNSANAPCGQVSPALSPEAGLTISPFSPAVRSQRISLCLIVKNEEANLAACLQPATSLVDEIIVVDTGSTDRTREIARGFGAKVVDFPWVDSFAAARNESLRHATGDWIFWLDADDRLDQQNQQKLKKIFEHLSGEIGAYMMQCVCPSPDGQTSSAVTVAHARLFRRHARVQWRYRVHEQILLSIKELGGMVYHSDVEIRHEGYQDEKTRQQKLQRNLSLLQQDAQDHPQDAYPLFYLGWTQMQLGQIDQA